MATLSEEVTFLEKEVKRLEKLLKDRTEQAKIDASKLSIKLFLGKIILPYIDGLCEGMNQTPEDGVAQLIKENNTIDKIATKHGTETANFLKLPELNVLRSVASDILSNPDTWYTENSPLVLEVMDNLRPTLSYTIRNTEGGTQWLNDSLLGIKNILLQRG